MTTEEKLDKVFELLRQCNDDFLQRFISLDSTDHLDEKIEVISAINSGKAPAEVPNYYECMDSYPGNDVLWD